MPIVRISLIEGRAEDEKRALLREVTDGVVRALGVEPERVRVLIEELPPQHWAVAGIAKDARR